MLSIATTMAVGAVAPTVMTQQIHAQEPEAEVETVEVQAFEEQVDSLDQEMYFEEDTLDDEVVEPDTFDYDDEAEDDEAAPPVDGKEDDEAAPPADDGSKKEEDEWVNPTDEEIKKNDDEMEKERKEAEKEREKLINDAGKEAGKIVLNLINGKYKTTGEAIESISISAIKIINSSVIKNIPYVGNFFSTIIDGEVNKEKEDQTVKRLDEISGKLDVINQTIEDCTSKMMNQQEMLAQNDKINAMNKAYSTLMESYKVNSVDFNRALTLLANDTDKDDPAELTRAGSKLDVIYTPTNREVLNQYINYCNEIMNSGKQSTAYAGFSPNVFAAFKNVVTYGKDGEYAYQEFTEQRNALIASVKETGAYGYEMLNTIIDVDLAKQEALRSSFDVAMKELEQEMKTADAETYKLLKSTYTDLKHKKEDCEDTIAKLEADQSYLQTIKGNLDSFIANETAAVEKEMQAYSTTKRQEYVTVYYNDYGTEVINGKTCYPSLNGKDNTIEYRDVYGNLLGKRTIGKELKEVDQYAVEVGKTYTVSQNKFSQVTTQIITLGIINAVDFPATRTMRILKVYEKPYYTSFMGIETQIGTVRTIVGHDLNTNKAYEIEIGGASPFNCFEIPVGNLEKC